VARAALARLDAWEPRINAMYRVAREAGARAGARLRGALARGPSAIAARRRAAHHQENIYTRGDPAPIGTRAHEDARRARRRAAAARAREAGCVLLGKDHHADYGMLSSASPACTA